MDTLSKNNLPASHRDSNINDRPGEIWEDIPGLDGLYRVSNQGRIKRLDREIHDSQGGHYILAGRIIIPSINFSPNKITRDQTHRLQVTLQISRKKRSFMVHRLVYYCFVNHFPLEDMMLNVVPKNGDGLDVRPSNLLLLEVQERCVRTYDKGRLLSPMAMDPQNIVKAVKASTLVNSKEVSQFDKNGKWIATYESTMDASRVTGIANSSISSAAKRPSSKRGSYYWRFGHKKILDIKEIEVLTQKRNQSYKKLKGIKVTQFDLEGHPITFYEALSEAAKVNHISHKCITDHLKGKSRQAGGFLWKLGCHIEL
jgi:NUMOD4 motif/NUMOD1 domain